MTEELKAMLEVKGGYTVREESRTISLDMNHWSLDDVLVMGMMMSPGWTIEGELLRSERSGFYVHLN